ncbi:unnamed protein product [Caenorhabditis auriculariae]|uniref:Uncharacterized protein n=1 Tax=Caenorhabditis auriculariae TaxID=2777116 RepID=A0A8S1H0R6_9PELO|nr:unnamed protein product [Caenorhabditis auriculariae]
MGRLSQRKLGRKRCNGGMRQVVKRDVLTLLVCQDGIIDGTNNLGVAYKADNKGKKARRTFRVPIVSQKRVPIRLPHCALKPFACLPAGITRDHETKKDEGGKALRGVLGPFSRRKKTQMEIEKQKSQGEEEDVRRSETTQDWSSSDREAFAERDKVSREGPHRATSYAKSV